MLEFLSHSSHFLPFLSAKRRREIGKTQPSFFYFSPHFQISPPIEADFRKYLLSLMCKRSKESDMDNLMRKLPIEYKPLKIYEGRISYCKDRSGI